MNTVEDRLRAATQAAAQTVAPGSAPPLRLPSRAPRRLSRPGQTPRRRWNRIAIPLAAAAAVAAVVISSVYLGQQRSADSRAATAALAQIPPYFLTTGQVANARHAWIAATATGKAVATVPVPRGDFIAYLAAGGHGTFAMATVPRTEEDVVGGFDGQQMHLFLIRFQPGSRTVSEIPLANLDVALAQVPEIDGITLSPNGSKLAVALSTRRQWGNRAADVGVQPKIMVADLRSDVSRTWTWPFEKHPLVRASYFWGPGVMSFGTDNQTLWFAFQVRQTLQIRQLDSAAAGTSLSSSTLSVSWAHAFFKDPAHQPPIQGRFDVAVGDAADAVVSSDGSTVVIPQLSGYVGKVTEPWQPHPKLPKSAWSRAGFTEFSARTGQRLMTVGGLNLKPGSSLATVPGVLWAGPRAQTLIVATRAPGAPLSYVSQGVADPDPLRGNARFRETIAVLHDGHLISLPVAAGSLGQPGDTNHTVRPVW